MDKLKRFISAGLVVLLFAITIVNSNIMSVMADTGNAPTAPTGLKVELLEEPYGIDTTDPSFSWVMNDQDNDEYQTAYRIVVATSESDIESGNYIYDSNWVASSESASAKAEGISAVLEYNSLYYWQVQIKDKDGNESPLSDWQAFTTAVGDSNWDSIDSIWHDPSTNPYLNWTDYTLEAEITTTTALGIVFRAQDSNNFYFWQFRSDNNTLVPHTKISGSYTALSAVSLSSSGVTIPSGTAFKIKIDCSGNTITTYIDADGSGYVQVDSRTMTTGNFTYGSIGFRTGNYESGTVSNIKVTNSLGTVLYEDDFSSGTSYYSNCTVSNGVLNVPTGQSAGSLMSGYYASENANFVFLRTDFEVDADKVEKAIVSVSAKSPESSRQYVFNLYMNGEFVGLGPTRYTNSTVYYNTYDVTDLLLDQNAIGAINYTQSEKAFLLQMTVFYKDGTSEVLLNSGRDRTSWTSLDGTSIYGDDGTSIGTSYFSAAAENINANLFPYGWDSYGYDDSMWNIPISKGNYVNSYKLSSYYADNVNRYLTNKEDITIVDKGNGNYFIDLGKEIVGGVHLEVNSPVSQQITMNLGEELSSENTVKYSMITGNKYQQFWTLKAGEQVIENIGMMTFRYIEIFNWPDNVELKADNICGIAMYQDFDESASDFTSSNTLLNKIYDTMKYTIKATNQDLMVDSQSRERGSYEGDVLINMLSSYAFESDYTLSRFSIEYGINNETWPAEYKMYSVIMAWYDYMYTGNSDLIETYYDKLKTKTHESQIVDMGDGTILLQNYKNTNNSANSTLVDWPTSEQDTYTSTYSSAWYNSVLNAVAYGTYTDMAKIAEVLGNTTDQAYYSNLAEQLKAGIIKHLYSEDNGAIRDGLTDSQTAIESYSQHATVYCLAFGVYEDEEMAAKLVAKVKADGAIKTSVYGAFFVLSGLYNADGGDVAMELLNTTGTRSYYHMIEELGATISTEAWDPANKSNMTYSHPWSSAPASQIVQGLFGIQPTTAGYSTFQVKLQPGDLESASVTTPTIKGSISASYQLAPSGNELISASVTIPANTKATVSIPDMGVSHDYLVIDGELVEADSHENGYLTVELGSGEYSISVPTAGTLSVSLSDPDKIYVGQSVELSTIFTYPDGTEVDATSIASITYESSNTAVATVDTEGVVTYLSEGTAVITATAYVEDIEIYNGAKASYTLQSSVTVSPVTAKITDVYIEISGPLHVGSTATSTLKGLMQNGTEVDLNAASFEVSDSSYVTVDSSGVLTGLSSTDTDVILTALMTDGINDLVDDFDIDRFVYEEIYSDNFDSGDSTFGLTTSDGAVYAAKGNKVYYNDSDAMAWTDYTVSAKFKIESNAANITFRVNDASTFYLWQFRSDTGILKTHVFGSSYSEGYLLLGEHSISDYLVDGYNEVIIRVEGNKFSTYLNGTLVNVTYDSTLQSGSVGIRNGNSESFYLDDLVVSTHAVEATTNVSVLKALQNDLEINYNGSSASEVTKTYGDEGFDLSVSGGSGNGDVTWASDNDDVATVDSNGKVSIIGAGEAKITATKAGGDDYSDASATLTIIVSKATLTITAADKEMTAGDSIPELTYSYSGFVNGDNYTALKVQPSITTTADSASPAGTYNIIVSGAEADNYEIKYVNGTLTIKASESPSSSEESSNPSSSDVPTYEFTEGFGEYTGEGDITATVNGNDSNFVKLLVNGEELDSSYYTIENGTITLKEAYLSTLANGTYTLIVEYADGYAETTFTVNVEDNSNEDPSSSTTSGTTSKTTSGSSSGTTSSSGAKTGDITAVVMFVLLVTGAIAIVISKRRKSE